MRRKLLVGIISLALISIVFGEVYAVTCGTAITQWGSSGSGNGQFNAPDGVAVDGSGNVYVADTGNDRIQKFACPSTTTTTTTSSTSTTSSTTTTSTTTTTPVGGGGGGAEIPEFPTVAIPAILAVGGYLAIRRLKKQE